MKKYFIDTSVIAGFLRNKKESTEIIRNLDGEMVSSYISLSELYEGVYRSKFREKTEKGVKDFFSGLSEVYGIDEEVAKTFGKVRSELKKEGNVIEDIDIFLAATCLTYGLTMITLNKKHFDRVPGLQLY